MKASRPTTNARAGSTPKAASAARFLTYGLPPEGSTMGVGDEVKFWIDAEFTGPPVEETEAETAPETP